MVAYRRHIVPGGTYFFTLTLRDRSGDLLVRHIDLLRTAYHDLLRAQPVTTEAIVILPDHLHALWTLLEGDGDFPGRWQRFKSAFVRALTRQGIGIYRNRRGEALVWQRRYWEHAIRDTDDFTRHIAYIHYNPVRHGLVDRPRDWPYSSVHRYIATGTIVPDWAEAPDESAMPLRGERE